LGGVDFSFGDALQSGVFLVIYDQVKQSEGLVECNLTPFTEASYPVDEVGFQAEVSGKNADNDTRVLVFDMA
jgi:hypothetical protein